ncbi:MAG: hypothetical protein IPH03_12380 [Tetrasphaera sp.]|nr:hypothetical protein [Tetrasphaera sp.]
MTTEMTEMGRLGVAGVSRRGLLAGGIPLALAAGACPAGAAVSGVSGVPGASGVAGGQGSRLRWTLISRMHNGRPSGFVQEIAMSANARVVVFQTFRALLPDGGGFNDPSLYAYDRSTKKLSMVSANAKGVSARGGENGRPVVSPSGRWVVFSSASPLLMPKGALGTLVVKDLATGAVRRLAPTPQQSPPGARPFGGVAYDWSADGHWLLVGGTWPGPGYDPSYWLVEWPSGVFHRLPFHGPEIEVSKVSADGSLVTGSEVRDPIGWFPFVVDVATGRRRFIAAPTGVGPTVPNGTQGVYLSGDGTHVTSSWRVGDLDYGIDRVVQISRLPDLRVEQVLTQENTGLESLNGVAGIDYDGSHLLLATMRRKPDPYFIPADLYRYNRQTGARTRVTVNSQGVPLNSSIDRLQASADLRTILIGTGANNLVKDDAPVGEWLPIRANDVFTVDIDPVQQ